MTERPEERDSLALIEKRLNGDIQHSWVQAPVASFDWLLESCRTLINEVKELREENAKLVSESVADQAALTALESRLKEREERIAELERKLEESERGFRPVKSLLEDAGFYELQARLQQMEEALREIAEADLSLPHRSALSLTHIARNALNKKEEAVAE